MVLVAFINASINAVASPAVISLKHIDSKNKYFTLRDIKMSLAGGLAGGITNAILFPLDTFKTMRQTDRSITSVSKAIERIQTNGISKAYSGFLASVIGSTSSSAIYFGTYEWSKRIIFHNFHEILSRPLIHSLSAISGNVLSSIVFVPKDAIKQQMQSLSTQALKHSTSNLKPNTLSLIKKIYTTSGIKGFYPSYRATLIRNIPNAVLRFTLYEELRLLLLSSSKNESHTRFKSTLYLVAGGLASSLSSGLTTPLDVVKTRLATGMIPPGI